MTDGWRSARSKRKMRLMRLWRSSWVALAPALLWACGSEVDSPSGAPPGVNTAGGASSTAVTTSGAVNSSQGGSSTSGQGSTVSSQGGMGGTSTTTTTTTTTDTTTVGAGGAIGTTTTQGGSAGGAQGGSAGTAAVPTLDDCPAAPQNATAEAITALNTENTMRLAMGLDCAELVSELIVSAQNHCDYYVQNDGTCTANPHNEVDSAECVGFTGASPGDRMSAAGYMSRGGSETMAFSGDPERAVMMFIDSVYHRTPILDPWMRHLGYGFADGCDTIDFGRGPETPDDVTAFYPYAGQTDVPVSFDGSREGPEPPAPSTGWPSGYPVTLFGQDLTVVSHTISLAETGEELPHLWLDESDPTLPSYAKVLYSEAPLEANTTYHVVIQTTRGGSPLDFDWTFTTGEPSGFGR